MTKPKKVRGEKVDELLTMTLTTLEDKLKKLEAGAQDDETRRMATDVRVAIRKRQKILKNKVMLFEATNDHHLVLFESTCKFWKMAGRSVLIYSQTVAERIAQRYRIVPDTDTYAVSREGVISFRNFELLNQRLHELGLERDMDLEEPGIIFFRMKKVYTDEQIEKLRDKANVDRKWLEETLLPESPMPALYEAALKLNRLLYANVRMISDRFARQTFGEPLAERSGEILQAYYRYANLKTPFGRKKLILRNRLAEKRGKAETTAEEMTDEYLLMIWEAAVEIRDRLAIVENLKLIHWRAMSEAIVLTEKIEKMVGRMAVK